MRHAVKIVQTLVSYNKLVGPIYKMFVCSSYKIVESMSQSFRTQNS